MLKKIRGVKEFADSKKYLFIMRLIKKEWRRKRQTDRRMNRKKERKEERMKARKK